MHEDIVEVEADAAVISSANGEAAVVIVVGYDAGHRLDGAQRIVRDHAGQVLGLGGSERQLRRALLAHGVEGRRLDHDGFGLAERIGAKADFEFLHVAAGEGERLLDHAVADGRNAQYVITGGHGRELEPALVVGNGGRDAGGKLDIDLRQGLASDGIFHYTAYGAGRLSAGASVQHP